MNRFGTLDMMRGLAAFAVVVYHIGNPNPFGYVAVDLFFILSGFVLCHAYGGRFSFGEFMRVRFIRLYPMFAAGVVVGLFIREGDPLALLMIPDIDDKRLYPVNTALWSVAYELIASLGFILLYRFGKLAWFAFWFGSLLLWGPHVLQTGEGNFGWEWEGTQTGLSRMTFAFTTGIALHWLFTRYGVRRQTRWAWLVALFPFGLTFLTSMPLWATLFVILPLVVYAGASYEVPERRLASLSGDISYPLYAIHMPVVVAWEWMSVPFVVVAAWLLDRYYDRPVRKALLALFGPGRRRKRVTEEPATDCEPSYPRTHR